MICKYCGSQIDDKAVLCVYCKREVKKSWFRLPRFGKKPSAPPVVSPSVQPYQPPEEDLSRQLQSGQNLSYSDKEQIIVSRISTEDMRRFDSIPYIWNTEVKKFFSPNGHPFAYIDLLGPNIDIAKQDLEKMNSYITSVSTLSQAITKRISIPINKIVFAPQKHCGYTRLICTPYTIDGAPSPYPVSLSFMTDLSNDTVSTHGDLFYGQDGTIRKAEVFCWRTNGSHFYYFASVDDCLVLERFERDGVVAYKAPHILAKEATRAQEEKDFVWLETNLPEKCPKSLSGFRRMKNQNTKNYQLLKQLAAELGREI